MTVTDDNNHPFRLGATNDMASPAPDADVSPDKSKPRSGGHLPDRYSIKTNGDEEVLICLEAPNLNVHIEAGLTFSGSIARKSPSGTIFLDGVAQCEPFMDHERQVYNLDHHEGCVRSFTLASCEQALVMYMKGLELRGREWRIFANEPDLDTILAIWILLNHSRIGGQDKTQRRTLFALVRYEGVIDALGLELKELSALPPDLMRRIQRVIDHLRSDEIALKKEGRWEQTDYLLYTASILHKIDQIFYKASDFEDYRGVEEIARIDLTDQRIAAVVEADMGIYEIEPHLNKIYGNRLGIVFLKKGLSAYTVRQMDLFMPISLEDIYERLNFVDPAVKCRTFKNKWGGAADIGGSPRETGTQLSPSQIARVCREAVRKPDFFERVSRFAVVTAVTGLVVLTAFLVRLYWNPLGWFGGANGSGFWDAPDFGFALVFFTAAGIGSFFVAYGRPWQYGWISPQGRNWFVFMPIMLIAGFSGGIWIPSDSMDGHWTGLVAASVLVMPVAVELFFRSFVHGLLAQSARIQRSDTRWFLSWPAIGSTALYLGFIVLMIFFVNNKDADEMTLWQTLAAPVGALLFGASAAMLRERSHSVFPPLLCHLLTASVTFLVLHFLMKM